MTAAPPRNRSSTTSVPPADAAPPSPGPRPAPCQYGPPTTATCACATGCGSASALNIPTSRSTCTACRTSCTPRSATAGCCATAAATTSRRRSTSPEGWWRTILGEPGYSHHRDARLAHADPTGHAQAALDHAVDYPEVVAFTALLASPYWRGVLITRNPSDYQRLHTELCHRVGARHHEHAKPRQLSFLRRDLDNAA